MKIKKLIPSPVKRIIKKYIYFFTNIDLYIHHVFVKDKMVCIVGNNCIGADVAKKLRLRYNSPTVNLQIMPAQYSKFCENIEYYLKQEIVELKKMTYEQKEIIYEVYKKTPEQLGFPFGIIDDIIVCFQHYSNFYEAKSQWDRRKVRFDKKKAGYILIADPRDSEEGIKSFCNLQIKNRVLFLMFRDDKEAPEYTKEIKSDDLLKVYRIWCLNGTHFMDKIKSKRSIYEKEFNGLKWVNSFKQ